VLQADVLSLTPLPSLRHREAVRATTVTGSFLPSFHDMGLIGTVFWPLYGGTLAVSMSPLTFLEVQWL
jgi:acyl-CoA synthetase (AMP-forming)/AMP-acid ligase II